MSEIKFESKAEEAAIRLVNPNEIVQKSIPVESLQVSSYNTFDANDIEDLKNSIATSGLLTPLTVVGPDDNGVYEILSGERRYRAVCALNEESETPWMPEIPCYVVATEMDPLNKRLIIESANLETRDFNRDEHRFELVRILREMADNGDLKKKSLAAKAAKYMAVSPRYAKMYLAVYDHGDEALRSMIGDPSDGKIGMKDAATISYMPAEEQRAIIDRISNGEKARDVIKDHKGQKDQKEEKSAKKRAEDIMGRVDINALARESEEDEDFLRRLAEDPSSLTMEEMDSYLGYDGSEDFGADVYVNDAYATTKRNADMDAEERRRNEYQTVKTWIRKMTRVSAAKMSDNDKELMEMCRELIKMRDEADADVA